MKKMQLFAALFFAFTAVANAQLEGFGWDGDNSEVVARIGLGGYSHVEAGLGLYFNGDGTGDSKFNITASGRYLLALHSWEKLTGFLNVGGYFRDDNRGSNNNTGNDNRGSFQIKAGYQPELLLVPHLAVSILFGAAMTLVPDFSFSTMGDEISIVNGLNFRVLF
jgi:hypothetical protein